MAKRRERRFGAARFHWGLKHAAHKITPARGFVPAPAHRRGGGGPAGRLRGRPPRPGERGRALGVPTAPPIRCRRGGPGGTRPRGRRGDGLSEVEVGIGRGDRALLASRDEEDVRRPCGHGLLDGPVDRRAVHDRQRLLRLLLREGEETRAQAGGGDDDFPGDAGPEGLGTFETIWGSGAGRSRGDAFGQVLEAPRLPMGIRRAEANGAAGVAEVGPDRAGASFRPSKSVPER